MWHILLKFLVTSTTLKQPKILVVLLFYCVYLKGNNLQRKAFFEVFLKTKLQNTSYPPYSLAKANHKASQDSRGGEIDGRSSKAFCQRGIHTSMEELYGH